MDSTLALGAFRIGRDAGGEAVREREPRIPKPPGCSQGAQRAVFCAVRVADFLAEGAGVGSLPRAWRRVGVPPAASVLKKFVRLASTFPSPPFGSSDLAGPRRPRLYGFDTHSEPVDSGGTRAAKRYVYGNLGFRTLLVARWGLRGQLCVTLVSYTSRFRSGGGEPPQGVAASWGAKALRRC